MIIRKFKEYTIQDCISSANLFVEALNNVDEINKTKEYFNLKKKLLNFTLKYKFSILRALIEFNIQSQEKPILNCLTLNDIQEVSIFYFF